MANPKSRLTQARAAIRPEMKGRVMLSGPPGAGKTYTALIVAQALVGDGGRILVIDSEKESALTYADLFSFDHLRWNPPFDPTALAMTLKDAQGGYDCTIVDSFSHWWRKQGGVLDIAGDNIRGWKVARPVQEDLIDVLLDVDMHMIVCCRSKMDHLIQPDGKGGFNVTKMGLKAQQDDDLEYEVNVALEIDMPHVLSVVKSRTNEVPVGTQYLAGYAGDFALHYRDWLRSGEPVAPKETTDQLAEALGRIPDEVERKRAKYQFLDAFGRPEFLLVSRLPEAQAWVADRILGVAPPVDRAEDDVPPDEDPDGPGVGDAPPGPDVGSGEASSAGNSDQGAAGGNPADGASSLTPANSVAASPAPGTPAADPTVKAIDALNDVMDRQDAVAVGVPGAIGPHRYTDTGDVTAEQSPPPADGQKAGNPSSGVQTEAQIRETVKVMTVEQVRAALAKAGSSTEGAPAAIRKRLVDNLMEGPF